MFAEQVVSAFELRFKRKPALLVRAPGRVNLIGEHTDYNDGFVLPMAIDRNLWIAAAPRKDARVHAYSMDLEEATSFDIERFDTPMDGWGRYVQGVAWALKAGGLPLAGWDGLVLSNVPMGSGLSTSAALELAVARCFSAFAGFPWDAARMAKAGQRAENEWVGMNCGIMDQLIVAAGKAGHALLIDCRSLALRPAALPAGYAIVIMDTATRRGLVDSGYNERRSQCEEAAALFGVASLRDVSKAQFEARASQMNDMLMRRCRHVISENERTVKAFEAMRAGDVGLLGRLMDASHDSLRDDYEVTNEALNVIVRLARAHEAVLGARMTGGGFGGCAIALVENEAAEVFATQTHMLYLQETGLKPSFYVCNAADGASIESLPAS